VLGCRCSSHPLRCAALLPSTYPLPPPPFRSFCPAEFSCSTLILGLKEHPGSRPPTPRGRRPQTLPPSRLRATLIPIPLPRLAFLHAKSSSRVTRRSFFEVGLPTREELQQLAGFQAVLPPCRGSSQRASSSTLPRFKGALRGLIRNRWIWRISPSSGKVLPLPLSDSYDESLISLSLHYHQTKASRSHRRTPGELLVAHMG
jgi:hypothetical protein